MILPFLRQNTRTLLYGCGVLALGVAFGMSSVSTAAAAPLKIDVSGFYFASITSADRNDNLARTNMAQDAEIHFKAKTMLDSGLEIGLQVELEAMDVQNDPIDESYVYFQGGFGKVIIGAENGASYLGMVGSPDFVPGITQYDNNLGEATIEKNLSVVGGAGLARTIDDVNYSTVPENMSSDEMKFIYFTPRINGFRGGISYAPNNANKSGGSDNVSSTAEQDDIISYHLDYSGDIGQDMTLAASFGYETADNAAGLTVLPAAADDPETMSYGLKFGIGMFEFGGAYSDVQNFKGIRGQDIETYNVAATYRMGATKLGIGYTDSSDDGRVGVRAAVDYEEWLIGAGTKLADGVSVGYFYQDAEASYAGGVTRDVSQIGATIALYF
jgi:outer membrane protein OmpU